MTRDEAIEIARRAATGPNRPSYHAEPFQPHEWVVDAILAGAAAGAEPDTLRGKLHAVVDRWLGLHATRLKDELDYAMIKISIHDPGGDDDGTLYLDFTIEEENAFTSEQWNHGGGRVTGATF